MPLLLLLWLSIVPQGQILVKGAAPAASDATTPVPEQGRVAGGSYRNAYFGLTYPIPAGWKEQPAGPPPSDSGTYVLGNFATARAYVAVTAQDLFFSTVPGANAKELLAARRQGLEPVYTLESEPAEVTIAGRTFHRLAYKAPVSGIRWRVLATDVRCHALTFTFAGADTAALDAAEQALAGLSLKSAGPACVAGYADVVAKEDPVFTTRRYNTIPVRVIVDAKGRVKHVHLLSAFPDQAQAILAALRTWTFKPYRAGGKAVEVETGIVFGMPPAAF
ncbi:MAG TPA: hypothetical protein VEO54_32280 [Thermoanaerobaculia bacterium]|nr:hypothetical protein [Thermoanaerobaculia bacterium]